MEGEQMWKGSQKMTFPETSHLSEEAYDDKVNATGEEVRKRTSQEASQNDEEEIQDKEVCSELPEDLAERILAMVPFPYIFKARALSKSWRARFEPIDSQDDEVKRHVAISFQSKVSEWSTNWKPLYPVFFDREQGLFAYDRACDSCPRMPSLSFMPWHLLNCHDLHMDGALLLLSGQREPWNRPAPNAMTPSENQQRRPRRRYQRRPHPIVQIIPVEHMLTVANFLTRRWKQLPSLPATDHEGITEAYLFERLVSQPSQGTYKVIVFMQLSAGNGRYPYHYLTHIYDSRSNAWRSKNLVTGFNAHNNPTYFNGVLYIVGEDPSKLLAFSVEEETFQELQLDIEELQVLGRDLVASLVVCKESLLMIVIHWKPSWTSQILKIDLGLQRLWAVSRGPPAALNLGKLYFPYGSDAECICFEFWEDRSGMVLYDMRKDEWSRIPFPASVMETDICYTTSTRRFLFQPNLNPFLAV